MVCSALAKPLKLKTSIHVPRMPLFFFGALQLALAGKAGQDSDGGKELTPAMLYAVICKLWAELHCAHIDSHLPRIITLSAAWIKVSVSLL